MQPPHSTPERLPAQRDIGFASNAKGGGNRHVEDPQAQYPGGHRVEPVRGASITDAEFGHRDGSMEQNAAQNPLVTFTDVVQEAIPNGQLEAEGKGRH